MNDVSRICLGPMADIWMYVVSHVKSEKSVETMKGNLKLHSSNTCNVSISFTRSCLKPKY